MEVQLWLVGFLAFNSDEVRGVGWDRKAKCR